MALALLFANLVLHPHTRLSISSDELYDKLVDYELFLQGDEFHQQSFPAAANYANRSHGRSKRSAPHTSAGSPAKSGALPSQSTATQKGPSSSGSGLICQLCDQRGHTTKTCYQIHGFPPNHPRHQANVVQRDTRSSSDQSWLLDSGAYHVTYDLANLSLAHDYHGDNKFMFANGNSFPITHSGTTQIHTPTSLLHLTDVLYVSTIS